MSDLTTSLQQQVEAAIAQRGALRIVGGDSKAFYGRTPQGEALHVAGHSGIVSYEPTELVITARAGTPLDEIEQTLHASQQMLPFEPPHFGAAATLGGTIACNLSGPRRPYSGAARDFVLGTRVINGKAEVLRFGGEVMKNVAGYDVSRMMTGALGTLGVLLDISLKVLPRPASETTLVQECSMAGAIEAMNRWATQPLPLSASAFVDGRLYVRLYGTEKGVQAARAQIGGERLPQGDSFWRELREQQLAFFKPAGALWRLSVPPNAPALALAGECLLEWGGGLRWLSTDADPRSVRAAVTAVGGHATLFRGGDRDGAVFQPLDAGLALVHQRLKNAFDPQRIFNPGRMYQDL